MRLPILVVDDNEDIVYNVREYLQMQGYIVETATNGLEAMRRLEENTFGVCLLDIGLPQLDGLQICKKLRENSDKTPILMLTARDSIDDRVKGLEYGADDYLVKPFALRELGARVDALFRRVYGDQDILSVDDLTLNLRTGKVMRSDKILHLNPTCIMILKELMLKTPAVVNRSRLHAIIWQGSVPDSDSLRANIYLLRQAVDRPFTKKLIKTHPGVGWSIEA